MKLLFIESDGTAEYNCSNWRCIMPARALAKAGIAVDVMRIEKWVSMDEESKAKTKEADITFLQRNAFAEALEPLFYYRSSGCRIAVDLDDSYENMTEDTGSPSYKLWHDSITKGTDGKDYKISPSMLFQLRSGVKLAGIMTSPSKLICEDWKEHVKTYWFPNYLDLDSYVRRFITIEPNKIYVGWGGSMTHLVSWQKSGCAEAMRRIIDENPNVVLLIGGDPRIERYLKDIPKKNRLAVGWVAQPVFMHHLSRFHIGLVPLYGEYDRRRSWLKVAEYSVMGIPWIGSEMEPTEGIGAPTGLRVKNEQQSWYQAIKFYVDNFEAMQEAAQRNTEQARQNYGIQYNTDKLIALCEQIIRENK